MALIGYSIGGALAHAIARRLEDDGVELVGVAMIDTYSPEDPELKRLVLTDALGQILSRDNALTPVDDHGLVALGGYVRIYPEREAKPIAAPTLNLRATVRLSSARVHRAFDGRGTRCDRSLEGMKSPDSQIRQGHKSGRSANPAEGIYSVRSQRSWRGNRSLTVP